VTSGGKVKVLDFGLAKAFAGDSLDMNLSNTPTPRKKMRLGLPWVVAIFVLGFIIAGMAVWMLRPTEPRQVIGLEHHLPEDQNLGSLYERAIAASPDGGQFVYKTTEGLYIRPIDEFEARLIIGTDEYPERPFFSPDRKWVGYWSVADNQLKKIGISGGAPVSLTDDTSIHLCSLSRDFCDKRIWALFAWDALF
jgi:hypothetical protein